jgi:hypothetical protein
MRQSTLESDFKKLYDLRRTEDNLVQSGNGYHAEADALYSHLGRERCTEQTIDEHLSDIKKSAVARRKAELDHQQTSKAWGKTPAHRRKQAVAIFNEIRCQLSNIGYEYSGETSHRFELTLNLTSAETVVTDGERYSRNYSSTRTNASHRVYVNPKDLATVVDPVKRCGVCSHSRNTGMIPVRLIQVKGLPQATANESVYEAAWVQCVRYRLVLKTGFIAYNDKERVEYHLEKGDAKKALTGLRRKITLSKKDPNQITPNKGKVTIDQVISKTGWCRPGCEEFAERMLGRLSSTDKGYDLHRILRAVERIIGKGKSHTYFSYAIKLKKMLRHAEVAATTKEVAA